MNGTELDVEKELESALTKVSDEAPCGCGRKSAAPGGTSTAGDLPSPEELEASLAAALGEVTSPEEELEFAALEETLSAEEDLAFAGLEEQGDPIAIADLVSLAERFPGLKITFSF